MRDLTGQAFGSYRLEELIGRGGMGEVYRARHSRLADRFAAVKVLPAALLREPDFLRRFEQEANSAAKLDHPNILPVWDYGEQDGIPYLAMPLVTGGSLRDLLEARGPLPPEQARRIVEELGAALDYAHGRGIIHRDVKPANVLLHNDGRPLLADFGIAKAIEGGQGSGVTSSGTIVGTPHYMAPEQARGRVDARSDLYALGVILYQMLTGREPYSGDSVVEVLMKHQQETLPLQPLHQVTPPLPAAVTEVLQKALAKEPDRRYQEGRALAGAFSAALAPDAGATGRTTIVGQGGERTQVAPPSPRQPTAGSGATRLPLLIGGLIALMLLVGGIFALTRRGAEPTTAANAGATSTGPPAAAAAAPAQTQTTTSGVAQAPGTVGAPAAPVSPTTASVAGQVAVVPTPTTATPTATTTAAATAMPTVTPMPRPTPTATVAPTATPPVTSLPAEQVASDIPGTPLTLGVTVTSLLDKDTKKRAVYAVSLPAGQTLRVVTKSNKGIDVSFAKPGAKSIDGAPGEELCYNKTECTGSFLAVVPGTYYLRLNVGHTGVQYSLTANTEESSSLAGRVASDTSGTRLSPEATATPRPAPTAPPTPTAATAAPPTLTAATAASIPPSFIGVWEGTVVESATVRYPTRMTLTATGGEILYPSYNCTGRLTLVSVTGDTVTLRERIISGNCHDNGTIVMRIKSNGEMDWQWHHANGSRGIATLKKT